MVSRAARNRKAGRIMTEPEKPNEPQRIHISFEPAPPRPKKVRRYVDIPLIVLACGIIGTVFKSSAVFGITCGLALLAYIVWGPPQHPPT